MMLNKILRKLRTITKDFGKVGGMAGITTFLPIIGSAILLVAVYEIGPWLRQNKGVGVVVFVVGMSIFSGFALLATNILGIVSGFAFGFQIGVVAQMLGLVGASTIMFYPAKRFAGANLQSTIEQKPRLKAIQTALLNESFFRTLLIITLIRLSPATPFALTNFTLSAAGVSFRTFLLGTVLGMLPRTSAIVFVGSSLSELNFSQPQESWMLIVGIIATVLAIVVVGMFSKRALEQITVV
jgi:uncharacterized membrane protein YdjX (TVP38/TMEM64 family)